MRILKILTAITALALATATFPNVSSAEGQHLGNELYKATMLRAAPGKLEELIEFLKAAKANGYYGNIGEKPPMIMRHSQGDQWDLLLLQPIGSYGAYYGPETNRLRETHEAAVDDYRAMLASLVVFREELFAYGPDGNSVASTFADSGFFHIEMFAALAGAHADLIREREMENNYLVATGRKGNAIFIGDQGSDIDVFTIGFYRSLQDYAAPAPVPPEAAEEAARDAGFEARGSIGFYLRRFLTYHHDTLATKVD